MKPIASLIFFSSVLLVASATTSSPQFGPSRQLGPLAFQRRHTVHAVRGGQEEAGAEANVEVDPETAEAVLDEEVKEPSQLAKKLANLKERLVPAVLMLGFVSGLAYYMQEEGLAILTLLLQVGMYEEMTNVIGGQLQFFMKWWWFLTASLAFNGPRLLPFEKTQISASVYGMSIFGIVSNIVRFQITSADASSFREFLRQTAISLLAGLLVVLPSSYWISLLKDYGMIWMIYAAVLVIVNDTMAYVFGMTVGKNPLLASISPKKTWEGFIGAAVSTVVVAYYWLPDQKDAIVLSSFASLIGPFGGFLASIIKRAYEQKDFGALFPGHGGFVDRLDCQLVLAPFVYLYLALTKAKTP